MLFVSGLFAMHENFCAAQEAGNICDEAHVYGTYIKKEARLWYDVGKRPDLEKDDEFM